MNDLILRQRVALAILPFVLTANKSFAENSIEPPVKKNIDHHKTSAPTIAMPDNVDSTATKTISEHHADAFELPEVAVIGTTPLGTTGLESKKISGNVQSVEDEEINRHEAISLPDFMNRRLQSVNINDTQNNPYQPDVSYRGFSASPILGTPIGLSVYQDGVRVNEAFGDTVNWDLIPQIAIANMDMMPGSNPLFGLNTLGGALSIRTKSGFSHPGFHAQASGGSFGRQNYQAEVGGSHDAFDWYFAGNLFRDNGWRPYSPTNVNQGFGKIGWEDDKTDLDLSFTYAGNDMQGVGSTPQELLQENWSAIFTAPDVTQNTLYSVNLKGNHAFTEQLQISGNIYNRHNNNYSLNSNTTDPDTCSNPTLTGCNEAGITPAYFQASRAQQNGTGINVQLTSDYPLIRHENQLMVGGGFNYAKTDFKSSANSAIFTPDHFEITSSSQADSTYGPSVGITGENRYSSLFATDTFTVFDWLHTNASANWLQAQVNTADHLNTTNDINYLGNNLYYQRLNPSAGLTFDPFGAFSVKSPMQEFVSYFNYNEGFRAPTVIELACANPDAPCSLPNGFVSDPYLKPVVSHTLEAGLRGKFSEALKWNFAVYQTLNDNDILFLNAPTGSKNAGYFSNVGTTQRQGLELGLNGLALDSLNWYISYGFVDATYQSAATLNNAYGEENVVPGNRIPGIPQNTLKVGSEYEFFKNFFLGTDIQYVDSQFARGDDQNIHPQIGDYALVNLNSRYVLTKNIELFATGRNIFDNRYVSFGQMGINVFSGQNTQFQGPGTPVTGYAGVRVHWD